MTRTLRIGLLGLAVAIFAFGFYAGAQIGIYQFGLLNGAVKASLLAGELQALRGQKVDGIIQLKELELDFELSNYARFRESGHPWIFWPTSRHFEHDQHN